MRERTTARVAAAALLLLAACGGSQGSATCALCGGSASYSASSDACVEHINALRASIGLGPLARWSDAEACAGSQAESDGDTGKAHGAFGRCGESAQNECPGWGGVTGAGGIVPGCLDMMWAQGPGEGHYDTMASRSFTRVACGFHQSSSGAVWAVQDFR